MFLRYALIKFVYFFNLYDNMFGLLGLSQFTQNVAINAKGGDYWQYVQLIKISMFYGCHLWQHILFYR